MPAPVAEPEPSRTLVFDGCFNFRDLGGYPTADGRRTRWRRLFRADGLSRLTENDLATLATLGVVTVIDLRTDLEADTQGRFPPDRAGVSYHHLPLTDTLPGEEESADWDRAAFVSERYLAMLSEGTATVSDAIGLLADPARRPAVFHCSVGKDRTGVLAALVLGFLGVPDDVIVDDYALSYDAMLRILAHLKERYPESGEIVERYRPVILSAAPASMAGFVAGVRRTYGSFDDLAASLGVTAEVDRLRAEVLESA
ncbi:MAG TPA: tyrosine-protein phosphatase [Acidimicrobiales bacterium]|nr:tyrosine-protein phosphatase [Acidimicrobiales bacterium]